MYHLNELQFREDVKIDPDLKVYEIVEEVEEEKKEDEPMTDSRGSTSEMTCATEGQSVKEFKPTIKPYNVVGIAILHGLAAYTLLTKMTVVHPYTFIWGVLLGQLGGFGVTGGAHRLWTHRSYKAKLPLRIILSICYSIAGQNSLLNWVRDHRVHHKYSETDADPHNSTRGFFFSHVGWLMQHKHPDVKRRGKEVDLSDLFNDPVVMFHEKYFGQLKLWLAFLIPIAVPCLCWRESLWLSFLGIGCTRYALGLNFTWLVNSAAHIWGNKPYNKHIKPAENRFVSFVAMGEGYHNYHHTYPYDYKAAELGKYSLNTTTFIIDMFAKIGWAYDLKTASQRAIQRSVEDRGDGTHAFYGHGDREEHVD